MSKKTVSAIMLKLLLASLLTLASNIQPVMAEEIIHIHIRADGSVDPPTAPIQRNGDLYTLTGNISVTMGISVQRDNIVIDGSGYAVGGTINSGSYDGIYFEEGSNVTIKNTNIKNFRCGIILSSSCNNSINGNNITNNNVGIVLDESSNNNNVSGNTFIDDGLVVSDSYANIVENNTVNGKPLVYLEGVKDHSVDDAGQVVLIRCYRIRVEGLNISRTSSGVQLCETNDSIISGNNITNNSGYGIGVDYYSNYNSINGNTLRNNDYGIVLSDFSNCNSLNGNNITNNNYHGIALDDSLNNSIVRNNITNNNVNGVRLVSSSKNNSISENNITNSGCGIKLAHSSDNNSIGGNNITNNNDCGIWFNSCSNNTVSHNNFINNTVQVEDLTPEYANFWDNGCEGNYWSNYNGTELDNDGVGDTFLPWEEVDNCPLMNMYWNPCDINHDLKVDFKDIGPSARAFGTVPGDTWWNPHADITGPEPLVPDGKVDMHDISLTAKHFGERYP